MPAPYAAMKRLTLSAACLALAALATPTYAVPPSAPTTIKWDKQCKEVILTGAAPGSDLGVGKAELMTGMCPNGVVVTKGFCWQ